MQAPYATAELKVLSNQRIQDIAQVMHWVGVAMLGFFLVSVGFQAWPVALLQPAWLQKMTTALMGGGMTSLTGALLLAAAHVVDPEAEHLAQRARLVRRLASWVAIGYLLLIPVQLYAGVQQLTEARRTQTKTIEQVREAVKAIEQSTTLEQLRKAYNRIPGRKPELPAEINVPLNQLKDALSNRLEPNVNRAETQFNDRLNTVWQQWIATRFRDTLLLLMLFLGFAAIGRSSSGQPTLLESVSSGGFLRNLLPGRRGRGGGRRGMMASSNGVDIPQEWIPEDEQVTK